MKKPKGKVIEIEKSKVWVIDFNTEGGKVCGSAVRVSTTKGSASETYHKISGEKSTELTKKAMSLNHKTVTEHAFVNFAFDNVSAIAEQFLIEFRLASFTIKSRRYVDFSDAGFVIPEFRFNALVPEWKRKEVRERYIKHCEYLFRDYNTLLDEGVKKEDARFFLPYSFRSNIFCSVNARELLHIIYSATKGGWSKYREIELLGKKMLQAAKIIFPGIFENFDLTEKGTENADEEIKTILSKYEKIKESPLNWVTLTKGPSNPLEDITNIELIKNKVPLNHVTDEDREKILDVIIKDKRNRSLEHASFTFSIGNITLSTLTHLERHRMQSLSIPKMTDVLKNQVYVYRDTDNEVERNRYAIAVEKNKEMVKYLMDENVMEEDITYLLLSGNAVSVSSTMNARELLHFFKLRICNRAQEEIRYVSERMLHQLRILHPTMFSRYGASCEVGGCTEGSMSCKKNKKTEE